MKNRFLLYISKAPIEEVVFQKDYGPENCGILFISSGPLI